MPRGGVGGRVEVTTDTALLLIIIITAAVVSERTRVVLPPQRDAAEELVDGLAEDVVDVAVVERDVAEEELCECEREDGDELKRFVNQLPLLLFAPLSLSDPLQRVDFSLSLFNCSQSRERERERGRHRRGVLSPLSFA